MKRIYNVLLVSAIALCTCSLTAQGRQKPSPSDTPISQQEKLDRGFIRLQTGTFSPFLSWRLKNTDDEHTSFLVLKDGAVLSDTLRNTTSYRVSGLVRDTVALELVTLQDGVPVDTIAPKMFNAGTHHVLQLKRPASGTVGTGSEASSYSYSPNDCSVADVDGDGEYELIVKWDPSNSKDNSQGGYTGFVHIDCYKIFSDSLMWRISLGKNIRAGAHYTQYLVYDFDGDGKAELVCKTAPGSKDGIGNFVSAAATEQAILSVDNNADYRVSGGRINGGHEYLTVFNGETGAAIHTVPYLPNRNANYQLSTAAGSFNWYISSDKSDTGSYGNRGERYLAGVAYLDGPDRNPSAVMCRGMYTRSYLWAVDFDGKRLSTKWIHASLEDNSVELTDGEGNKTKRQYTKTTGGPNAHAVYNAFGQGAHSLTIGDVDGDGCDEIVYGSATVNNDGWMLYSTGYGHGDALHLGDFDPDRDGLEVYMVHEEGPYGAHLIDAATGEVLWSTTGDADNGRGVAADILSGYRGSEFWSAKVSGTRTICDGNKRTVATNAPAMNFRIFWDGDPQEELLDGTSITKCRLSGSSISSTKLGVYTTKSTQKVFTDIVKSPMSCNSTKATPCLQADIFGDWREEVIWWNGDDPSQLFIFSSTTETDYRVPSLMYDHTYRMAVAWQNSGYNQPPHLGYYLPDFIDGFQGVPDTGEAVTGVAVPQAEVRSVVERRFYNMAGQRVDVDGAAAGVYVESVVYSDGSRAARKVLVR